VLVVTNETLARRQMRKANWLLLAAMLILMAGFFAGMVRPDDQIMVYVSTIGLVLGFFLWQISQYFVRRYGPRNRQDAALERALKKLDNRYTLISFAAQRLPDYLLLGPHGVRVLVPRDVGGTVRCQRDRWSRVGTPGLVRLLSNPLRDPTTEAAQSVQQVERYLARELEPGEAEAIPVTATIVFTNPNVRLEVDDCRFPAARAQNLPTDLRRDKGSVTPAQIAQLRQLLAPAADPQSSSAPPRTRTRPRRRPG
jgi:hypothetical protein